MGQCVFLVLAARAAGAGLAEEQDSARWWHAPTTNAVPAETVELILVYKEMVTDDSPPKGPSARKWRRHCPSIDCWAKMPQ